MADVARNTPPDRSDKEASGSGATTAPASDNADKAGAPAGADGQPINFLQAISAIEARNQAFIGAIQRASWQQSLRAWRSQHPDNSKYRSDPYKNRSKHYRPKTRSAVRKNLATAASALFSNADVVSIKPQSDRSPQRVASASIVNELLNYRLDRTTGRAGIPWFLTSMGANLDAQVHGICISKQFWEYRVVVDEIPQPPLVEAVLDEATGAPMLDETGLPVTRTSEQQPLRQERRIKDRPMCALKPPENVYIDPAAPWEDPIQGSSYLSVLHPMTVGDARSMLANPGKSGEQWLDVSDDVLKQAASDYNAKGVRVARGGGTDRYDNRSSDTSNIPDSAIVWLYENFLRIGGEDYHFWTVGALAYCSKVRRTEESYPEQFGDRPYVMGYGAIESHEVYPMSAIEAWRNMQNEINDQVNLRFDLLKRQLSPIAKVRQGSIFDWKQLQRRSGPDTSVIVSKMDDLEFEQSPGASGQSYQEMNYLNADFDDLAGSFSTSSVQSNRNLNETVGGMKLMSGAANAVTEYDLRVWVETWVEPVLRQLVRLIQFYEDDQTILAIAGEKAQLEKFGVDQITDEDLMEEVSLRVNVGIGALDPMQRLQKTLMGFEALGKLAPFFDKPAKLNAEEVTKEIMGAAGQNDGMRFFTFGEAGAAEDAAAQQANLQATLENANMQLKKEIADGQNKTKLQVERMQMISGIIETILQQHTEAAGIKKQAKADVVTNLVDAFVAKLLNPEPVMPAGGMPGMPAPTAPAPSIMQ